MTPEVRAEIEERLRKDRGKMGAAFRDEITDKRLIGGYRHEIARILGDEPTLTSLHGLRAASRRAQP